MSVIKILATLFILFTQFSSFSQQKIYLNENMKQVDSSLYYKKSEAYSYKAIEYDLDSLTLHKILYKFSFGKLNKTETKQILNLLAIDSGKEISKNNIIIIKYYDSIYNYQTSKKKYDKHVAIHKYDTTKISLLKKPRIWHKPYNKNTYTRNNKRWEKFCEKCVKKFEKINMVKVLYSFKHNQKNTMKFKDLHFVKDRSVLKNTFFKIMYNFNLLVLKPNGEYFLSGGCFSDNKLKQLLKADNWENFKSDWENSIKKYPNNGFGFFSKPEKHEKHCF